MDRPNQTNNLSQSHSGNGNNQIENEDTVLYGTEEHIQFAFFESSVGQINVVTADADLPLDQVEDYCHNLAIDLKKYTREISEITFDYFPITDQPLIQVPLHLYREIYSGTTESSSSISTSESSHNDEINFRDLFTEASRLAEAETSRWENETAKQKHRCIHGNIVGISGPPGIGKTTLSKLIAREILENNLFDSRYIFFIRLRDINYDQKTTLLKLLLSSTEIRWDHDPRKDNAILRYLDLRDDVIIIMDGLNEASMKNLSKITAAVKIFEEAFPEEFVKNLIGGKVLQKAKKLLTSRPHQLYELHHHYRPRFIANILGINEESQKALCSNVCATQDCLYNAERVYNCISNSNNISSYCYNPLNCILCAYCVNCELQLGREVSVLGSLTKLFILVLEKFVESDHMTDRFEYEALSELAWKGLLSNKLYFSQVELENARQNSTNYRTFLHLRVVSPVRPLKILTGQKRLSFSHVMLQEFLAAVHLRYQMSEEEFRGIAETLYESRFESVTKFLFGLFNQESESRLFVQTQLSSRREENGKLQMLKEAALRYVRTILASKDRRSFSYFLRICCCVHELQNNQFAEHVAVRLGKKLKIIGQIFPSDIAGFCCVLGSIKENFQFYIGPCLSFFGNSLQKFFEELQWIITQTQIFMPLVDLAHNNVDNKTTHMLCRCFSRMRVLRLCDCNMTAAQLKILANYLTTRSETIYELNLSYNNLGDASVPFLTSFVSKVDILHLSDCRFNEESIELLSREIALRNQIMNHFCISRNITRAKLRSLSKCVGKINNLVIGFRHASPNIGLGLQDLSTAILMRAEPMESLFLRGSHIGDEGFIAISKCLKNIKHLRLYNTYDENLTSLGIRELSSAFSGLEFPMEKFVFTVPAHYLDEARREFEYCDENIIDKDIR